MLMTDGNNNKTVQTTNHTMKLAVIEGVWGFTTFMIGAGASQAINDPFAWVYGGIASFMAGFVGYLVKFYGINRKKVVVDQ